MPERTGYKIIAVRKPVNQSRFEMDISRIKVYNVTATPTCSVSENETDF
jgi:hypothetical protein